MMKKTVTALLLMLCVFAFCAAAHGEDVSLTVGGKTFTCAANATEIDLGDVGVPNTDGDYSALVSFLHKLPNLTKVDMFSTDIPVARLDPLAGEFPQIRFGWTIIIPCKNKIRPDRPPHRIRTDDTAFSTSHNLSSMSHGSEVWETVLKYCPDLLALDIGHNNSIRDYSFLRHVPKLRVLIMSFNRNQRGEEGPPIDISVLGELKDLEFLEICKSNIADISPLANCTKLVDLNIGTSHIKDLSPLYGLKNLRRVFLFSAHNYSGKPYPKDKVAELQAQLPDCFIDNSHLNCGGSWRQTSHYKTLASMFSYQLLDKPQAYEPFDDVPHDDD